MPLPLGDIISMMEDRKELGDIHDHFRDKKWYRGYCKWCGEDLGILTFDRLCWDCDKVKIELDAYNLKQMLLG